MKHYLCQIVHFLFLFQVITAFLGSAFFHTIQKIRYKFKQTLPTHFHCLLLKISMIFFFIPTTIILYVLISMYHPSLSSIQNNALKEINHLFFILQTFILSIGIIGTIKKIFQYIGILKQINQHSICVAKKITDSTILKLSYSIQKHYGIKKVLPIYIHPYIPSPSITGILHPKILLPEHIFLRANPDTLQIILSHEILHYKKKDIFWYYFSAAVQSIYWYLPSVKTLCNETKKWLEYECDERCCKENQKHYTKQEYFNTILDLLHNEPYNNRYTLEINFYKNEHQVEDRIIYMHSKKEIVEIESHICLLMLFSLLCVYFFFFILSFVISFHLLKSVS